MFGNSWGRDLYLERRISLYKKFASSTLILLELSCLTMALVITVAADIEEPQQVLSAEKQMITCSLSDYGYSSETSFTYPGELLSDDEFNQEFSSSCASSRRSSKAAQIPLPPPPPPLSSASNMISFVRIPTPPPLPTVSFDGFFGEFHECNHSSLFSGFCPNPNCMSNRSISDDYYTDEDDYADTDSNLGWHRSKKRPSVTITSSTGSNAECIVCFSDVESLANTRKCCSQVICRSCISEIVRTNIEDEGNIHIPCPNPECNDGVITSNEILSNISGSTKGRFDTLRLQENQDGTQKTCPNCCLLTEHKIPGRFQRFRAENVVITCSKCQFVWCFRCHAPWHASLTCRKFQRGDKHFKKWTKSKTRGNANCQKCPLCRVYIQRSTGCDHMTCNRCETEFCYKCGGTFTEIPGLGNHYGNTSIFGCTANYKPDKPIQRKAVRGGYLAAKLAMLAGYPVLFIAGVAVVVVVGAVALPIYGGYRYYKFKKRTNEIYGRHRRKT